MVAGAKVESQYLVPADAWYFAADRQPLMPFAVLLEAALLMRDTLQERGLRSAIGIATGRVFCGAIGSERRGRCEGRCTAFRLP